MPNDTGEIPNISWASCCNKLFCGLGDTVYPSINNYSFSFSFSFSIRRGVLWNNNVNTPTVNTRQSNMQNNKFYIK